MRIGIFTNNYLPNPFGVSGSIESFRRQFEKKGHTVYIFAPHYKNHADENPNVFRYPSIDLNYKISFPLAIPYSRKMEKIIDTLDLDIIHSQHPNLLGKVAQKWAKKKNIPLVFTWHTLYNHYVHFAPLVPNKLALSWIIRKAVKYANSADQIVVPTESIRPIIEKWGVTNKNITTIPTGVEEEYYQNPDRVSIRLKLNIKDVEILLLLVSRITEEKNIEFLFNSVLGILEKNINVKFLVAGDGNLIPKLKMLALKNNLNQRIIFEGIVNKKELKNYYAAGDIFVYASKSETQGMVVSEAMYLGLPIVAVIAPGICDLVKHNGNGILVEENEASFAEAVEKLIEDAKLRYKFGETSKKIARENFTNQICAQKMLDLYSNVISRNK